MKLFFLVFLAVFLFLVGLRTKRAERVRFLNARIALDELAAAEEERKTRGTRTPVTVALSLAAQARIKTTQKRMRLLLIAATFGGGLFAKLFGMDALGVLLCSGLGLGAPFLFLQWRKRTYMEQFRFGMQDLTEFGMQIFQVSSQVDDLMHAIIKKSKNKLLVQECSEIVREAEILGQTSLKIMQRRALESGIPEYRLLAEMTRVATETDASLVTIYRDINSTIRRYFGTEKKIMAKTSGMRKVGFALSLMPVPTFMFFWPAIEPHLTGGIKVLFYITVLVVAFGAYTLNKVVNVRV